MEGTAYKALLNGRLFEEAVLNWQTAFIADASDERTGWSEASASAFYHRLSSRLSQRHFPSRRTRSVRILLVKLIGRSDAQGKRGFLHGPGYV